MLEGEGFKLQRKINLLGLIKNKEGGRNFLFVYIYYEYIYMVVFNSIRRLRKKKVRTIIKLSIMQISKRIS